MCGRSPPRFGERRVPSADVVGNERGAATARIHADEPGASAQVLGLVFIERVAGPVSSRWRSNVVAMAKMHPPRMGAEMVGLRGALLLGQPVAPLVSQAHRFEVGMVRPLV